MDKLSSFIDVFSDFSGRNSDIRVVDEAKPLAKLMEELNTQNQMFIAGATGQGLPITPSYTPFTVRIKQQKGQPTNRVTLKDTGAFHRSVKATFQNDEIEMIATDAKAAKLKAKYGKDILGLNDASLATVRDKLRPILIDSIRKELANV